MTGVLEDDRVVVPDEGEASTIHNRGCYGSPRSGGGLDLDLVEAAFLVELGRLDVEGTGFTELLAHGTRTDPGFEIRYLVYRDLRERGFVVELRPETFLVYPRGKTPKEADPSAVVVPRSERTSFRLADVLDDREATGRRSLLYGLVDEESDVTYYRVDDVDLGGDAPSGPSDVDGDGILLEDRVVVPDPDLARTLHEEAFYGRIVHDTLQVSLVEAAHLQTRGLTLRDGRSGEALDPDGLRSRAAKVDPGFPDRLAAYEAMRAGGLVVKTGFKYGTHFRVYRTDPDEGHAELLVHVVGDAELPWPDVAGFVRMAQSVRKTMVLAALDGSTVRAASIVRARP